VFAELGSIIEGDGLAGAGRHGFHHGAEIIGDGLRGSGRLPHQQGAFIFRESALRPDQYGERLSTGTPRGRECRHRVLHGGGFVAEYEQALGLARRNHLVESDRCSDIR